MTPDLRRHLAERARSLQLRLNHGHVDPLTAASEANRLFTDAADASRTRWLNLEQHGYAAVALAPLHRVLGVAPNDRLAAHVAAYRTQVGLVANAPGVKFRHFFVEPLSRLLQTRAEIASLPRDSLLLLEFAGADQDPNHPSAGSFACGVFDRIVGGFVAALHLQLGALLK